MSHDNNFFFIRTLWGALRHAEWDEAAARHGVFGLILEFFRALLGLSAWPFFVSTESGWQPATIRPILDAHGIESWGWGKHGGEFFFQVKLRQASWGQYLLQQQGVPLSGQLLDEGARSAYRPAAHRSLRPASGAVPMPRHAAPTSKHQATRQVLHQATKADAPVSMFSDPVGQINRAVDRLVKW
jgi:hypothetical protein